MNQRLTILAVAAGALLFALAVSAAERADKPRTHAVSIRGGAYTPAALTIRAGDSVAWSNGDDRDHTVTAADGSFNSGSIRPGGNYSVTFTKPGRYPYSCSLHPRMRGTITVQ